MLINLDKLVGKTIQSVDWEPDEDNPNGMGFPIICFEDDTAIYVTQDEESNGPGCIWFCGGIKDSQLCISTAQETKNKNRR